MPGGGWYPEAHTQPLPGADGHQHAPAGMYQPGHGGSEERWRGSGHVPPQPIGYTRLLAGRRDVIINNNRLEVEQNPTHRPVLYYYEMITYTFDGIATMLWNIPNQPKLKLSYKSAPAWACLSDDKSFWALIIHFPPNEIQKQWTSDVTCPSGWFLTVQKPLTGKKKRLNRRNCRTKQTHRTA